MLRYHFNVEHNTNTHDDVGTELANKDKAWEHATVAAGELIKHLDGSLRPGHDWAMQVTDEFENPLWEIHVRAKKK